MIVINVKFPVKPEFADSWLEITSRLTDGSRAEDGCLWYDWSRSVEEPNTFVLVEGWRDQAAVDAHNVAEHHVSSLDGMRAALAETPRIIVVNGEVPGDDWAQIAALAV